MPKNKVKIAITATDQTAMAFARTKRGLAGISASVGRASKAVMSLQGAFVGIAGAALVRSIVDSASSLETLSIRLKTVTGSAESARDALAFIEDFTATTPFGLQEVGNAFAKLTAFGLKPTQTSLTAFGNTASAMGLGLEQMMEAVADATTMEFERLKEFGIKANAQGNDIKFTFQGVTTSIGKNAAEIEDYLIRIGNVNFAGAMDAQMDTFAGKVSLMKEEWRKFLVAIADTGVFDLTADAISGVTTALDAVNGGAVESTTDQIKRLNTEISKTKKHIDMIMAAQGPLASTAMPAAAKELQSKILNARLQLDKLYFSGRENELLKSLKREQKILADDAAFKERLAARDFRNSLAPVVGWEPAVSWEGEDELTKQMNQWQQDADDLRAALKKLSIDGRTDMEKMADSVGDAFRQASDNIKDSLTEALMGTRSFADAFRSIMRDVQRQFIRSQIVNPFVNAISSALPSPFSGARANGGPVAAGSTYLVGERGPELFTPKASGQIVSNDDMQTGSVNVTFNINAIDTQSATDVIVSQRGTIMGVINQALNDSGQRAIA